MIRNVFNGPECYAICEKENNIAIGAVELKLKGHTDMTDRDDECELGYWLERKRGKGEAVLFARSATVGSQKYPVHWGGDCWSDYESMEESLRGGLSLLMEIRSKNTRILVDSTILNDVLIRLAYFHYVFKTFVKEIDLQVE